MMVGLLSSIHIVSLCSSPDPYQNTQRLREKPFNGVCKESVSLEGAVMS